MKGIIRIHVTHHGTKMYFLQTKIDLDDNSFRLFYEDFMKYASVPTLLLNLFVRVTLTLLSFEVDRA